MTPGDKLYFGEVMANLGLHWHKELRVDEIEIYWRGLQHYSLEQVRRSARRLVEEQTDHRFPLVGRFIAAIRADGSSYERPALPDHTTPVMTPKMARNHADRMLFLKWLWSTTEGKEALSRLDGSGEAFMEEYEYWRSSHRETWIAKHQGRAKKSDAPRQIGAII